MMHLPADFYHTALPSHHATGLRQQPNSPGQKPIDALEQLRQRVELKFASFRDAFMRMDRDNNGYISKDELLNALSDFNIPPRHLSSLLAAIDSNGDGVVSFSEFSAALRPRADAYSARGFADRYVTNRHVVNPNMAGGQVMMNDNLGQALSGEYRPDAELLSLPRSGGGATAAELSSYKATMSNMIYAKYGKLRDAFRAIDHDKDGRLSEVELKRAIRLYNLPIPEQHVEQLFAQMATRGTVDYETFAMALKRKDALGN